MAATTDQKARLLDLTTGVLELVRDGKRDAGEVCDVLQLIKDRRDFASMLRAEAINDLIVRRVKVNRGRAPQQMLDATCLRQYTDPDVVKTMPRGEGEEAEIHFFKLGRYVSDEQLDREYALRGLKPADPYSLAAVNEEDSTFASTRPNGTHWKDVSGRWRKIAYDERQVRVNRYAYDWGDAWWFAGLRK